MSPGHTFTSIPTPFHRTRRAKAASLSGAVLAAACAVLNPAHATYPGENGAIVFDSSVDGQGQISKLSPASNLVQPLTTGWSPRVSPNGKKVAFLRGPSSIRKDIFVMNIDGTNVVQLTSDASTRAVAWLPDGSRLAYVWLSPSDTPTQLRTMLPDGTGSSLLRPLTSTFGTMEYALDWAPSSNALVISDQYSNLQVTADVYNEPFTNIFRGAYYPAWAPDGNAILFSRLDGTSPALSLQQINADGSQLQFVPPRNTVAWRNVISPDGAQIAGAWEPQNFYLTLRGRAGGQPTTTWPVAVGNVDWARVPKNCSLSTPAGGGSVLGDVDWYADQCAVAMLPDALAAGGVMGQALAIGPDGRLYGRLLKINPLGGAPVWGTPYVIPGGSGAPGGINPTRVAIAGARDGSFQAVIINSVNQAVYHAMQYPNGTWSGFNLLDGSAGAPSFQARDVAIAINGSSATSSGNAQVIANGLISGDLYHRVRWPSGTWTGFAVVPGSAGMNSNALALASSDDLYTNVLAISTAADGSQGQVRQVIRDPSGNWGGWVTMPVIAGTTLTASSDVAVARTSLFGNPVAQVMVVDAAGKANLQTRNNPNLASSWQGQVISEAITTGGRTASISAGGSATSTLLTTRVYPQ